MLSATGRVLLSRAAPIARGVRRDERGVISIEFAFIAPLMILLLLGGTEMTQAVMASRKAATATRTMADLTAQLRGMASVTNAMIDEVYTAGRITLTPYPANTLAVTISRVDVTRNGSNITARTVWSTTRGGSAPRPCGALARVANTAEPSPGSFPAGMHYEGRFIVVDVRYVFDAALTKNFTPEGLGYGGWKTTSGGIEIRRTAYMQMRGDGAPTLSGAGACATS